MAEEEDGELQDNGRRGKTMSKTIVAPEDIQGALLSAVRDGDSVALAAWADQMEEADDVQGTTILRAMPQLLEQLQGAVQSWARSRFNPFQMQIYLQATRWSVIPIRVLAQIRSALGDPLTGALHGAHEVLPDLLARWDKFHPAIEWLGRKLGLMSVSVRFTALGQRRRGVGVCLTENHLCPVEDLLFGGPGRPRSRRIIRQGSRIDLVTLTMAWGRE
jgi:hypothetical protein